MKLKTKVNTTNILGIDLGIHTIKMTLLNDDDNTKNLSNLGDPLGKDKIPTSIFYQDDKWIVGISAMNILG